jgi:hypothetical protein
MVLASIFIYNAHFISKDLFDYVMPFFLKILSIDSIKNTPALLIRAAAVGLLLWGSCCTGESAVMADEGWSSGNMAVDWL